MVNRAMLIERKNAVIGALAAARRRLALARQSSEHHQRQSISQLEAEVSRLQAEERQLRLDIDRAAPAQSLPSLRPRQSTPQTRFDVLITAGYDRNKPNPLAQATGQPQKALINVAGKPMLWHVVRALDESGLIGEIVIVGLEPEHVLDFGRPVHQMADHGSITANQKAGAGKLVALNDQNRYVLAAGADTPLLTGDMVRWFIDACRPLDKDVYWGIVRREVMEATFPLSKRSYLRLREGYLCSGDLVLVDLAVGLRIHRQIERFFAARKSTFRMVRMLDLRTILRFLLGRLSVQDVLTVAERQLEVAAHPVDLPFAEAGMDVDKPHQLEQVNEYLATHPDHPANVRSRLIDGA